MILKLRNFVVKLKYEYMNTLEYNVLESNFKNKVNLFDLLYSKIQNKNSETPVF